MLASCAEIIDLPNHRLAHNRFSLGSAHLQERRMNHHE